MKTRRLTLIAAIGLVVALAAGTAVAASGNPYVEGSGDRIPLAALPEFMEVDQPFHISHGWLNDKLLTKYPKGSAYFLLSADGVLIEHTAISDCPPEFGLIDDNCELYLYDFPEGIRTIYPDIEEGTQVHFEGFWMGPCTFMDQTPDLLEPFDCPYDKWDPTVVGHHQVVETQFGGDFEPTIPNVVVQYPEGYVFGNNFVSAGEGFEYLAGGLPGIPGDWQDIIGGSGEEGFIEVGVVADGLVAGDWIGVRHTGEEQEATFRILDIQWSEFTGDTASGTATAPFPINDGIYVCWDSQEPDNISGCEHTEIIAGEWNATGLEIEPTWTVFVQYHDNEGDIQEVLYVPEA